MMRVTSSDEIAMSGGAEPWRLVEGQVYVAFAAKISCQGLSRVRI